MKQLLKERFQQLAGIKPLYINEALNKPLKNFGKDLQKRLESVEFSTKIFSDENGVPMEVRQKISENPKLAGISYEEFEKNDGQIYYHIEVAVHADRLQDLEKVVDYFEVPEGEYGPDKEVDWVIKNVKVTNPGDIVRSRVDSNQKIASVRYFTSLGGGDQVISRDK